MADGRSFVARMHHASAGVWPAVVVHLPEFSDYCVRLGVEEDERIAKHAAALYLCCACAHRNGRAIEIVRRKYGEVAESAIARVHDEPEFVEESLRELWRQLFAGRRPRVSRYSGKWPLRTWLRVVATRVALDRMRREVGGNELSWSISSAGGTAS